MIYVQEESQEKQLSLIEYLSGIDKFNLVLWNYPEDSDHGIPFLKSKIFSSALEPVTQYSSGIKACHTQPVIAKPSLISYLVNYVRELQSSVDSICLYPLGGTEWAACTIGHEGMCLVRDDNLLQVLRGKGFNVSTSAPDWW